MNIVISALFAFVVLLCAYSHLNAIINSLLNGARK